LTTAKPAKRLAVTLGIEGKAATSGPSVPWGGGIVGGGVGAGAVNILVWIAGLPWAAGVRGVTAKLSPTTPTCPGAAPPDPGPPCRTVSDGKPGVGSGPLPPLTVKGVLKLTPRLFE